VRKKIPSSLIASVVSTNKKSVFDPKTLSSRFMIFRRLKQLNSICVLYQMTLFSHSLLLVAAFISLLTSSRERISCDICLIFYRSQALSFSFLLLPKQRTSHSVFFLGDFYEFSRKNDESTQGLRIVSNWIPFDFLAYIQES